MLRRFGTNDPHLASFVVPAFEGDEPGYLQTSPEHAMKCLLENERRSMFQICPAFRRGEKGARHLVEFQMLEWYRCDYSLGELSEDLKALLAFIASDEQLRLSRDFEPPVTVTYRSLFEQHFGCNPHDLNRQELAKLSSAEHLDESASSADYFDALFSSRIEPKLRSPTIVVHYPECQAALATVSKNNEGDMVSNRFELFFEGVELANAYHELGDSEELLRRFERNNEMRRALGLAEMEPDAELLNCVGNMPPCSGIALGVDRLIMVLLGMTSLTA
ncbi:MAG: lysyl-tRNA synthetase class 2 [Candidatus Azotimanducaceae bacterium]